MKVFFVLSLSLISVLGVVKAWPTVKNPFEMLPPEHKVFTINDCMYVTSEEGDYIYKKSSHSIQQDFFKDGSSNMIDTGDLMKVCGLYVVSEPNTIVEITMKHFDVNCESGGLMGFVDGWELNGRYFPNERDHRKSLNERVIEFCNDHSHWPTIPYKKIFHSTQNSALLQYRIPIRGSFIATVRFRKNSEPCNIMVQETLSIYSLQNFGRHGNCTLTAIFPAVVTLLKVDIGKRTPQSDEEISYKCGHKEDRLEIGGSDGLDSNYMEKTSEVCGHSGIRGPDQAIFCEVTSARLISSGKYQNEATLLVRQANMEDLDIATLVCQL